MCIRDRGVQVVGKKYVYDFDEGNKDMKELLGGKGANLAEMTNLGIPVPPGFTIATGACVYHSANGEYPPGLAEEIEEHLAALEGRMGMKLGDKDDPLLVSVRSGARASMPGMMDTVPVSYTHLRAHETRHDLVCRLLLEKKKITKPDNNKKYQTNNTKKTISYN